MGNVERLTNGTTGGPAVLLENSLNLGTITLEREGGRGLTQGGL